MEFGAFSSIIESIYDAALDAEGWRRLLPRLAQAFGSESSAIAAWDTGSGEVTMAVATDNYTPALLEEYAAHYRSLDLWLARGATLPRFLPQTGAELVDDNELLRSEFYNDYLRRLSHFDMLGGMVEVDRRTEAFIVVHRPFGAARFDGEDKRRVGLLVPHLTQAMRLQQRLAGIQRTGLIATAALDAMPTCVIAVGESRALLFANAAAERLLSAGHGLAVLHGRLRCTDREADRAMGHLIRQACLAAVGQAMGAGGVLPAPRAEARPLSLLVCPLRPEVTALAPPQPMALIFVGDPDERRPISSDMLVRLYALTPAEARLVEALLAGDTLQDYADRAAISLHTVKTQLKHIFAKTGATRQADLIRDMLGNPVLRMGDASSR